MSAQRQDEAHEELPTNLTPQQYLEREHKAEYRSEFIGGKLYPMEWGAAVRQMGLDPRSMAGAERKHNRITASLTRLLGNALLGITCEPFSGDMRVKTNLVGEYSYPDVVVACDPHFEDEGLDAAIQLDSLNCTLALRDIYERIAFTPKIDVSSDATSATGETLVSGDNLAAQTAD